MTDPARQSAQAVAALFAERQRFESWLATLEAKRAVTPAHIYTRVHADYTARLQRVTEQLSRHRAAIRELESNYADRLTSLDIDEAKNRDEMTEAELRANVGELAEDEHREILERTALALERVTAERLRVTAELTNLRAMLGDDGELGVLEIGVSELTVTPTPPAVPVSPPAAKRGSKATAAAPGEKDAWGLGPNDPLAVPPRASGPVPAEDAAPSSPFDDLEFLRSMVDPKASGDHAAVSNGASHGGKAPAAKDAAPKAPAEPAKEAPKAPAKRASAETKAEPAPSAAPPAAPEPAPAAPKAPEPPAVVATTAAELAASSTKIANPSVSMELEAVSKSRKSAESATPAYLRDVPPEQVKTLKCQECGTLNYPTEWYCERCGAELAAL